MLESVKIQRRQSEIRQALAELVGKEKPTEDETRQMDELDREYRANETRYRAALIAEDQERREAGADLETREGKEWSDLVSRYEIRQAVMAFAEEGRALDGATAEVVAEMRAQGGYRGIPVPFEALEARAGETVASGTPDPIQTQPIIDRLFADSVAVQMGAQVINIPFGDREWPVVTSSVAAGWAATETGSVAGPTAFATTDKAMAPDNTLGVQMKVTRKTLKQSGPAIEQAIRRDMQNAIRVRAGARSVAGLSHPAGWRADRATRRRVSAHGNAGGAVRNQRRDPPGLSASPDRGAVLVWTGRGARRGPATRPGPMEGLKWRY
ncbi:phage major capsid family protein [Jhaorihella thermophila]|uniref:Phage major capsid protein, HK97 family n=1 Tax=Jhaorihella thermophila TaxID=488547 RepID=A0A1H5WTZ6_9RHOB|nr:phage major capsid protein, HK97 family [Jhaorihella thermophila]